MLISMIVVSYSHIHTEKQVQGPVHGRESTDLIRQGPSSPAALAVDEKDQEK